MPYTFEYLLPRYRFEGLKNLIAMSWLLISAGKALKRKGLFRKIMRIENLRANFPFIAPP
jgi:hypothetical protein